MTRHGARAAALGVSLVFSALLTAVALRLPELRWLAWGSFLPLFVVVRWLGCPVPASGGGRNRGVPAAAALAGGFWGACLYWFCFAGPAPAVNTVTPTIDPTVFAVWQSLWLLALLIVIPAVYVGLAARPARAIGFKLLTLALGWVLIEVVLVATVTNTPEPRAEWNPDLSGARAVLPNQDYSDGLHQGLLTGSQAEGPQLHWLARLVGYVSLAFLAACANASLVGIVSGARLSFPTCRSLAGSPNVVGWLPSQVVLTIQSWTLRQAYPRGPPLRVAVTN